MSATTTLPRIQDLPPEERREALEDAADRAMDAAIESAAAHNARKPDPRSILDYRAYHTMRLVCVLVVKHRDKAASIECSRDGAWPHIYLPTKKLMVQPESEGDFILALMPKSFLVWLAKQDDAPSVARTLLGVTPELAGEQTAARRETWKRLERVRSSINSKIYYAKRRSTSVISRGNAA